MAVFDPRLPEYRADPHQVLRGLRDESPVHRSSLGYWVLTRYADVFKAFRDPQLGGGRSDDQLRLLVGEGAAFEYMLRRLSNYDPPQHTRLRSLVTKAFTARRIAEMRPRIQAITEDLLDATRDLATFDAVAALAAPLPSAVIGDMLGVPSEDWHRLSGWTEDLQLALAPVVEPASLQAANSAAAHFAAYVGALVERRRARPGDDLLSELMAAADDGDKLNPDELIATVMFLFSAGHSTTRDLIGNGLLALMREPSLWAGLVSDPSLVPGAVEETLRYESPIAFVPRKARERLLIADVRIEAGEQLYLSPLAANRDPAKFPDPDRFDPRRLPNEHVTFGGGHHYCLGATLARAEAKIALELLARRCPVLELAVESVEWRPTMSFRGLRALPVRANRYGSDGTIGIAAIKENGGLTLSEAAFDHHAKMGMPQSAVSGGFVDNILPVEGMPKALLEYCDYQDRVGSRLDPEAEGSDLASHLVTICAILHSRLGRDFGQYKTSTILRRIRRRMQVLRIEDPKEYADQLRVLPDEPQLLFREILIGVTRFFRDPAIFEAVAATVIPALIADGDSDAPIRIWVAGCATGEEAYSIAILFQEACLRAECTRAMTLFATDVDDRAIAFARAGLFSDTIEADISEERLEHHFVKEGNRYRVAKHIRDMCVFSTHDLVKDPPFSKLDMISCRNLLIYFEVGLQQRVLATFHYGLKPRGALWLGPSETIASSTKLFKPIDKRSRIYERLDAVAQVPRPMLSRRRPPDDVKDAPGPSEEVDALAGRILARYAPAYVIVDGQSEVQRYSGPIAKFLEPVSGGASFNLFRLLHAELRAPARALVRKAVESGSAVREQVSFQVDGRPETINMIVEPMTEASGSQRGLLLAFQEVVQPAHGVTGRATNSGDHGDLIAAREKLQTVTEELETANEELQSSNEEFQSVNEELHSTVEELETSKEELQSINEELQTVNAELSNRADSLVRSNSDLANLFDSTSIATLFLDNDFCIRRFTPAISDIFNVREGDEGRPIADFASRLAYDALTNDARIVLRDLKSIEREVDSDDGISTFLLRVRPYRSLNNVIDGVSITLVDITERRNLDRARARLAAIVESSEDAIISHDLDGMITSWNAGAQKIYGYTADEIIGEPMSTLLADDQIDEWPANLAKLRKGVAITNFDISRTTKDDRAIHLSLMISPIRDEKGVIVGASAVARDIAERKAAEERALLLMAELDHRVKNILAVVSSVVTQTLRSGGPQESISSEIEGRILAIARAHNLLTDHGGIEGSLRELVATEARPYEQHNNVSLVGPNVVLTSKASLTLALAIHELATNAAKYGSLSIPTGKLGVSWRVVGDGTPQSLEIVWLETGGPLVAIPSRRGFGTKLIETSLVRGLGATVDRVFAETGVRCSIAVPLASDVGSVRPENVPPETTA